MRHRKYPTEYAHELFPESGGLGSPSDAIIEVRKRLRKGFDSGEESWKSELALKCEALREKIVRFEGESEVDFMVRVEKEVMSNNPELKSRAEALRRMVCFVIGHPKSALIQSEIIPKIDYWHYRSGEYMDFVFIGFSRKGAEGFDAKAFSQFVRLFEEEFNWKYSGGVDLMVFSTWCRYGESGVVFDTSEAMSMNLELAFGEGDLKICSFIESLIEAAKHGDSANPVWDFSDKMGKGIACSAVKQIFLSLLPKATQKDAENAFHFHVRDLTK